MRTFQNRNRRSDKLAVVGALIGFVSFAAYILGGEIEWLESKLNEVYLYGQHTALALVLIYLAINEQMLRQRLVLYSVAYFYIFITIGYFLNDVLDIFVQNKVFIYPTILMTLICCLYSLKLPST